MLAVQKAGAGQAGWRVSATGVVTGIEAAPAVVKKLKLVGHPFKVRRALEGLGCYRHSHRESLRGEPLSTLHVRCTVAA